ncbi:MAG: U32 family peptidase [Kiritimatiellia bacterium]
MHVELLAPAGDFDTALAAFAAGADAVYCGLSAFSARAYATNFSIADLKGLMRVARARGKKVYVTFNTVVDEADVEDAVRRLSELEAVKPSALIVQDLGVARLCRTYFPDLELHASTQLVVHNLEGVLALRELGFTRAVLARELSVEEIAAIAPRCGGMELECFIHGALCYSISGLCLFGAMEKGRSGNRGMCPYCCRQSYEDEEGRKTLAFSMKDLRLGEDVRKLVRAGVASLKIEGRMKSALYVASVTRYYRQILEGTQGVTTADLETVFSRRTTELYLNGRPDSAPSPIDPESLGHLGTPVGAVKRITKDREGQAWLRFHTARALERHDGLQFASRHGDKPLGFGITLMRTAISRTPVFTVAAGSDVEVLLPPDFGRDPAHPSAPPPVAAGDTVYCAMSNAVKRMFPIPGYRPSDYPGIEKVDLEVTLTKGAIRAVGTLGEIRAKASVEGAFTAAKAPEKTWDGIARAFSRLGETDYALGKLTVNDPDHLFAPMSRLNDLRRDLLARLDALRVAARQTRLAEALADSAALSGDAASRGGDKPATARGARRIKIRVGQRLPQGAWDEVVIAINTETDVPEIAREMTRLALPVYTAEPEFNRLRVAVKRLLRAGFVKWEASDLATLRMLKALGVKDITADWTCYAFNASALRVWSSLGVTRFVASPENTRANLRFLAESGYDVEFLAQQSTPLFISLTRPAALPSAESGLAVFRRDGLWVTVKKVPRTFTVPEGVPVRFDLSWNPV